LASGESVVVTLGARSDGIRSRRRKAHRTMARYFGWILGPLGSLLAACYSLVNNYAFAIVLFTMVIMVVFTPLTMKSTRSMMAMQQIQPEMKALQAKYRDDRQTLNTEMMALYQSHGVNPLGGCLPLLVQMPVFFALFALLRGLTRFNDGGTQFDPNYVNEQSQLFKDLSTAGGEMISLGLDLALQANDVVSDDLVGAIPYVLLVVVTGVTSWLQQRQMAARRTPGQEIPQQQLMLMKILPWMLPVFSFFMPAGLVVYFIVSNLWRVGQQAYIGKRIHGPAAAAAKLVIETETVDDASQNGKKPKSGGSKSSGSKSSRSRPSGVKPSRVNSKSPKAAAPKAGAEAQKHSDSDGAGPPRPRPRGRQANRSNGRSSESSAGAGSKRQARRDRSSRPASSKARGRKPAPRGPAPTGRTAGHGPNRSNKKKKR